MVDRLPGRERGWTSTSFWGGSVYPCRTGMVEPKHERPLVCCCGPPSQAESRDESWRTRITRTKETSGARITRTKETTSSSRLRRLFTLCSALTGSVSLALSLFAPELLFMRSDVLPLPLPDSRGKSRGGSWSTVNSVYFSEYRGGSCRSFLNHTFCRGGLFFFFGGSQ